MNCYNNTSKTHYSCQRKPEYEFFSLYLQIDALHASAMQSSVDRITKINSI